MLSSKVFNVHILSRPSRLNGHVRASGVYRNSCHGSAPFNAFAAPNSAFAGIALLLAGATFVSAAFYPPQQAQEQTQHHSRPQPLPLRENPAAVSSRGGVAFCEAASSAAAVPPWITGPSFYYEKMDQPERALTDSHAIFGPLNGPGRIERFNMYRRIGVADGAAAAEAKGGSGGAGDEPPEAAEVAVGDVQVGDQLNGHDGVVHGGIISLLFDDGMGWGWEAMLMADPNLEKEHGRMIVTANLSVDFRSALFERSRAILRVFHVRTDGRKIYFRARLESYDGTVLFAEANSLFIVPREKSI